YQYDMPWYVFGRASCRSGGAGGAEVRARADGTGGGESLPQGMMAFGGQPKPSSGTLSVLLQLCPTLACRSVAVHPPPTRSSRLWMDAPPLAGGASRSFLLPRPLSLGMPPACR